MTMISDNLQAVQARIKAACAQAGRPVQDVTLLAVSKTFGADAVQAAFDAGQRAFGENYIQEAVEKIAALRHLPITWHCIGPIQSNKTRLVAENFDWVHSVDRLKIAERLSEQRPAHLPPLQVCIQINIDGEASKSGAAPADAQALAAQVALLPRLQLRGLMCIPENTTDLIALSRSFTWAKAIFDQINAAKLPISSKINSEVNYLALDTLSMGMTADLEAAIACGSTMVRVGTAIFGIRSKPA
jgi:PLP dependent protein